MKSFYIFAVVIAMASALETEVESRENGVINLSTMLNSQYATVGMVIVLGLGLITILGPLYFGKLTLQKRRRQAYLRRYYQNHPEYRRRYYGGISRIGSIDYEDTDEIPQNTIESLDLVDTTFGLLNVESEACRARAICELERTANQNVVTAFLTKNLNSYVSGLEKYESAIQRGRAGQSCEEIYADCPTNLLSDTWKYFWRR